MQRTTLASLATISTLALLLASASLADDGQATSAGDAGAEQVDGEALADEPAHGMGEGDDAVGGGVATHELEGERGYASLEGEEREAVEIDPELGDWTIAALLDAAVVDGDGHAIGSIEDLIVDEDDRIRKVVLPLGDDAGTFVVAPIEALSRDASEGGGELAFTGDRESEDIVRVVRQDERWLPLDG